MQHFNIIWTKLIIKSNFNINLLIQLKYLISIFWLNLNTQFQHFDSIWYWSWINTRFKFSTQLIKKSIFYSQLTSLSHQNWWFREILLSLDHQWLAKSSTLNWLIISLELLLDALWWRTFADENCRVDWDQFNDSKISEKYEDLTQQMRSRILRVETARSQLSASFFAQINFCALTISHTLKDIIVALN